MNRLRSTFILAAVFVAAVILLAINAVPAAWGQPEGEDPTAWQGTVDAAVSDLFTQTASAPRNAALTQAVGSAFAAAQSQTVQAASLATATATPVPPTVVSSVTAAATSSEPATPLPANFPTDTIADVPIVYQEFERGYMYWLRPNRQIWVAVADAGTSGTWYCYTDTFQEGEQETDPDLVPPEGFYQPRRGFGKVWRTVSGVKDSLSWATIFEQELTSQYRYIPGGTVDANGVYTAGAGEHRLLTMRGDVIAFTEQGIVGDCVGGTWRLLPLGEAN